MKRTPQDREQMIAMITRNMPSGRPQTVRNHGYMTRALDRILDIWVRFPELRLGQLISNGGMQHTGTAAGADTFYIEDEELLKGIERVGT